MNVGKRPRAEQADARLANLSSLHGEIEGFGAERPAKERLLRAARVLHDQVAHFVEQELQTHDIAGAAAIFPEAACGYPGSQKSNVSICYDPG